MENQQFSNRFVIWSIDNTVRYIREVQLPGIYYFAGLCAIGICGQMPSDLIQKSDDGFF